MNSEHRISIENTNTIKRCALIYYSIEKDLVHVLVGKSSNKLTTIGGRKKIGESNIDCCVREIFEETKGVIDFRACPNAINISKQVTYSGCKFYMIEILHETLLNITEAFKKAVGYTKESNELESLEVLEIHKLIENLIYNNVAYKDEFKVFMIDVCYDMLCNVQHSEFIENLNSDVKLNITISELPQKVSFVKQDQQFLLNDAVKIIGVKNNTLYTEQFFFKKENRLLFKSGFLELFLE